MNATRYVKWAPGYGAKIDAETAYNELTKIKEANGGDMSAATVMKASRLKEHPLHDQIFDKSVKNAAEEYYTHNARRMIGAVIITHGEAPQIETRAFAIVREEQSEVAAGRTSKFYGSIEEALQHPDQRQYVLSCAMRDALSWKKRYAALSELATIFRVIDKVAEKVLVL